MDKKLLRKRKLLFTLIVILFVGLASAYYFVIYGKEKFSLSNEAIADQTLEFNEFIRNNSSIIEELKASSSANLLSEGGAIRFLSIRGLNKNNLLYSYSQSGEYLGENITVADSSDKHPIYSTYYETPNGTVWNIYIIDGEIYASKANENNSLSSETNTNGSDKKLIIAESDHLTSYDNVNDKFYKLEPDEGKIDLVVVDKVSDKLLDEISDKGLINNVISKSDMTNEEYISKAKEYNKKQEYVINKVLTSYAIEKTAEVDVSEAKSVKGYSFTLVSNPMNVVKKLYKGIEDGNISTVAECLNPASEAIFKMADSLSKSLLESDAFAEFFKEYDVDNWDIVECSVIYKEGENTTNSSDLLSFLPFGKQLFYNEAYVYSKVRFYLNGELTVGEDYFHLKKYGFNNWRIVLLDTSTTY